MFHHFCLRTVLYLLASYRYTYATNVISTKFKSMDIVKDHIQIAFPRLYSTQERGTFGCAASCNLDDSCIAFSETDGECYHYEQCKASNPENLCFASEDRGIFVKEALVDSNLCRNGGVWNLTTVQCDCIEGWWGPDCQSLHSSCFQFIGVLPEGEHWVYLSLPASPNPVFLLCAIHSFFTNTFIFKTLGMASYNRSFDEYVNGFNLRSSDSYWIGLETLHALTASGINKLSLDVQFLNTIDTNKYSAFQYRYEDVQIGNQTTGYNISFAGNPILHSYGDFDFADVLGDCLTPTFGQPFSAWDQEACASEAGAGWWFKDCNPVCNPLGLKLTANPGSVGDDLVRFPGLNLFDSAYADLYIGTTMYFYELSYP